MIETPPRVEAHLTSAPEDNPHQHERGIAVAMPYSREVVQRIKMLPEWCWTWRPEEKVWVVDVLVWSYVRRLLYEEWGDVNTETTDPAPDGNDEDDRKETPDAPDTPDNPTLFSD